MNTLDFQGVKGWFISTARSRLIRMGVWVYQDGDVLIDAGYNRACQKVLHTCDTKKLRFLMLTHVHEDHLGCASDLASKGMKIMVPALLKKDMLLLKVTVLPLYRRMFWGQPHIPDPQSITEVTGDQAIGMAHLRYIHTPGHSRSHHVVWDGEKRIVFLGDLYLGPRMTMAHPWEDPVAIAESLRKVRELRPKVAFCAHRGMLRHPVTALTRKIEYIEWLIERTRELSKRGLSTSEIANQLLGKEKLVSRITHGLYSRENVIHSILHGPEPEF